MQSKGDIRIADLKYESDKMRKDTEIFKLCNEFSLKIPKQNISQYRTSFILVVVINFYSLI